jgi:flagellar basal body-associated protein FliL
VEKNKLMMIVIILILAIMLAAVAFGFIYTIRMIQSVQSPPEPYESANYNISHGFDVGEMRFISLSDSIKVNLLRDTDNREHLALVRVDVGIASPSGASNREKRQHSKELDRLEATLTAKETIVRDIIIRKLSKTTYSDLRKADGAELLGRAITTELQNTFSSSFIVGTYFVEFFLQ